MSNTWGKHSMSQINSPRLHPKLRELLMRIELRLPFESTITETYRTAETQNKYYKEGNSKCDGYKILSEHQKGNAFDIVPSKNKWNASKEEWLTINTVIKEVAFEMGIKVCWGGTWKATPTKLGWDCPHYQLKE